MAASGLDYSRIRRYREWDENTITQRLRELHEQGIDLNAKNMEDYDITLITAARRRFDSWDRALTAAGLDFRKIVLRAPFKRRKSTDKIESTEPVPNKRRGKKQTIEANVPVLEKSTV